jgi:hypothetical protein
LRSRLDADPHAHRQGGASGTKVEALDNGADDQLTKRFPPQWSPGSGHCRVEAQLLLLPSRSTPTIRLVVGRSLEVRGVLLESGCVIGWHDDLCALAGGRHLWPAVLV